MTDPLPTSLQHELVAAAKQRYARPSPEVSIQTITPDLARDMLLTNTRNRSIKSSGIKRLIDDLQAGEWQLTNQGIGFSADGMLIDGQHRLESILRAQATVQTVVVFGLDPKAQQKVDRHTRRTLADCLLLSEDAQIAQRICEAGRAALIARFNNPSPPDVLVRTYIEEHFDALGAVAELFRRRVRGISRAAVLSVIAEYYERDQQEAVNFAAGLLDPLSQPERAPIQLLHEWLTSKAGAFNFQNGTILQFRATRQCAIAHWTHVVVTTVDPRFDGDWPAPPRSAHAVTDAVT